MSALLLDTCAAIWIAEKVPVSSEADHAMAEAIADKSYVYASPITGWEVGLLVARRRLRLSQHPNAWFERLLSVPGIRLAALSPRILIDSSFLPGNPPADSADRIFAATAREFGFRLMTRDRRLLAYAEQGHIQAVAC